jgi:hypothetical protein
MNYFIRAIIAVVAYVLAFMAIPPFFNLIGFNPGADLMQLIRVAGAGIAIFYVIKD